jgi:hypothetical protein
LTKVSLNDNPRYLALSYTWGAKIFKKIVISSVDRQRKDTVEVTANLEEALRYLRQESNPVCIWIDALCINQGPDAPEKTEQVGLMQHIYGQCTSAVVWLGPAAEGSDEATEALDRIGKKAEHAGMLTLRKEHSANWPRPDPEGPRNAEQKALDDLPVQAAIEFPHQAFGTLSLRSYWTIVWIMQEIALPTNVVIMCGHKQLSFSHFAAGLLLLTLQKAEVLRTVTLADLSDPVRGAALLARWAHIHTAHSALLVI